MEAQEIVAELPSLTSRRDSLKAEVQALDKARDEVRKRNEDSQETWNQTVSRSSEQLKQLSEGIIEALRVLRETGPQLPSAKTQENKEP